jgi:hypothetical protein
MLKFIVAGAMLGGLSEVSEVATAIAAVAAALAGIGWVYSRILRPAARAALRTYHAVDALEELPEFMRETRARLEAGSENFRVLEQRLSLAERAATSVATDSALAAEHTQAMVRELGVAAREE